MAENYSPVQANVRTYVTRYTRTVPRAVAMALVTTRLYRVMTASEIENFN